MCQEQYKDTRNLKIEGTKVSSETPAVSNPMGEVNTKGKMSTRFCGHTTGLIFPGRQDWLRVWLASSRSYLDFPYTNKTFDWLCEQRLPQSTIKSLALLRASDTQTFSLKTKHSPPNLNPRPLLSCCADATCHLICAPPGADCLHVSGIGASL